MSDIEDLVQAALNKDYSAAEDIFNSVMGEKMSDALDQEKVAIASSIYGDEDEIDIDDEDLEDLNDDEDLEDLNDDEEDEVEI